MTRNELASLIAKHEGKKVEVSIGNVREVLRILNRLINDATHINLDGKRFDVYGIEVLKALLK